jgi:ABC-2 type transport system ATP-binding protein
VGLDVEARRAFWAEIARMRAIGRTILLTTHYLAEADALADRITVIERGRVIAEGTPSEIKGRATGRKIRFRCSASVEPLATIRPTLTILRSGDLYEIVTDTAEDVTRDLLAVVSDVTELEITGAGLEEAFVAMTRHEQERVA